jgi:hypothetical protein
MTTSRGRDPLDEVVHQILEDGRIQLVMDFLTFAAGADEAGVPENRQMA